MEDSLVSRIEYPEVEKMGTAEQVKKFRNESLIRAKFNVVSKTEYSDGYGVELAPVTATNPENKEFFRWTPSGTIEMRILNKAAADKFEVGKAYFVDFSLAPS